MTRGGSGKEQVWLDEQLEGFLLSFRVQGEISWPERT